MSTILIVPGLQGSGPAHWQSWFEAQLPECVRVEQSDWSSPQLTRWAGSVRQQLDRAKGHVWIVAHSFGCLASLHATARYPGLGVAQILLVAPAEPTRFNVANALPQAPLAMRTCVVASDNDPWMSATHAHAWAQRWGSDWINLGNAGHINADSGYGPLPLAREWAAGALNRIESRPWRVAA